MAQGERLKRIIADLRAEQDALSGIVEALDDASWSTTTPAEGWDVRDQIGHLSFFDDRATEAIEDPDTFVAGLAAAAEDMGGYMERHLDRFRGMSPVQAAAEWSRARGALLNALAPLAPDQRMPWYGPPMSAHNFAVARLMEAWAHGQDVVDALGIERRATDRLEHIALLGVKTMRWSFTVNGKPQPTAKALVDLESPSGQRWRWNESATDDSVIGSAEDFCLVVTQRRNIADTRLVVTGPLATEWMQIAQAFAGPPGSGRQAGMFQ